MELRQFINSLSQFQALYDVKAVNEDYAECRFVTAMERPGSQTTSMNAPKMEIVEPGQFAIKNHAYPCALNAKVCPLVEEFFALGNDHIIERYCKKHPQVSAKVLRKYIADYDSKLFRWGGADLFYVRTKNGARRMITVETNSCSSGQILMPQFQTEGPMRGYNTLMEHTFKEMVAKVSREMGGLAVIYDKNYMEVSGYAAVMADKFNEPVYLVFCPNVETENSSILWNNGVLHVRNSQNEWKPIRACFRYVTHKPWTKIPVKTKTAMLNGVICCVAGGRNKIVASQAYNQFNKELAGTGLRIRAPKTLINLKKSEMITAVKRMGYRAVVKIPYSNAGQGVCTVTCKAELAAFVKKQSDYEKYLVQELVGHASWSPGRNYNHIGTVPDTDGNVHVWDLRLVVAGSSKGFAPSAVFARKALQPLPTNFKHESAVADSWDVFGTNLSKKLVDGAWALDTDRLIMPDAKGFKSLGIGMDELIDAYVQSALSIVAIDKMACKLSMSGHFDEELFYQLNPDADLIQEIRRE